MRTAIFSFIIIFMISAGLYAEDAEIGISGTLFWSSQPFFKEEVGPGIYLSYIFHPGFKMLFGAEYFRGDGEGVTHFFYAPDEDVPYSYEATMVAIDVSILYNFANFGFWRMWAGPCFDFNVLNGEVFDRNERILYELGETKKTGYGATVMIQTRPAHDVPVSMNMVLTYHYSSSDITRGVFDYLIDKVTRSVDMRIGVSYGF